MDSADISISTEQLYELALHWTTKQWQNEVVKLSPAQILVTLPAATPEVDPLHWKDKTHAVIESLVSAPQIEAAGRAFSLEQISEILSCAVGKNSIHSKLFPLFVGLAPEQFVPLLIHASPAQLAIIKQESISEPIQHHLTLLTQSLSLDLTNHFKAFNKLESQLATLDLSSITASQITETEDEIEKLRQACLASQLVASKALAIAWNSTRADLIEKLSQIKEQAQKIAHQAIGVARTANSLPTGLYAIMENHLESIFNNENNQPFSNDEPVLEALVKFSIWYLKDYWEVGLLPHITETSQLELDPETVSEKERIHYRELLFAAVENNLEKLGLYTLNDIKQHKIYSKAGLKSFIQKNNEKILPSL